jgi:DNA-binding NarL/FixJ family response regulator
MTKNEMLPVQVRQSAEPVRIVLADDNESVRNSLKLFIAATQAFRLVGEAVDGFEAIDVCTVEEPDLVLMDISMPVLDGIQATKIIRRYLPDVPILALSSFTDHSKIEKILEAGVDDCISKSITFDELALRIEKITRSHAGNSAG